MSKFVTIRAYYEGLRAEKGWPIVDLDATLGRHLVAVVELQDGVHQNLAGSIVGVQTFDAWAAGKAPLETKNIVEIANTAFASGDQAAFDTQQITFFTHLYVASGSLNPATLHKIGHIGTFMDDVLVETVPVFAAYHQPSGTGASDPYRIITYAYDGLDGSAAELLATLVSNYEFARDTYYQLQISIDTAAGEAKMFVNGAEVMLPTNTVVTGTMGTADAGTNQVSNGDSGVQRMADFWAAIDYYGEDPGAFYSASGDKYIGQDGSATTGVLPLVYLPNPAATFGENAGSSANLTLSGSFTNV